MKLIIAIVKDSDSLPLLDALAERRFGVTKLASTGGFLREGNTTLLMGVEDEKVEEVLEIIRAICPRRPKAAPQVTPSHGQLLPSSIPIEVEAGGAIAFIIPVEGFIHL